MNVDPTNLTHDLEVEFCVVWNYTDRAAGLVAELLNAWAPRIARATLLPSSGGRFEVRLDGELLYSKAALKRHPRPGEVHRLVEVRLGPPIDREEFH